MPGWLKRPLARPGSFAAVEGVLAELHLNTVCESARCPNRGECFSEGTATFLVMGDTCTRGCGFCAVSGGSPAPLDADEPRRVAEAARRMGLAHVVVTSVTRDDLPDGGASHIVAVIEALRGATRASVEVLVSDFAGRTESIGAVVDARPDVFNHNIETVPRLYAEVRPGADYARSLAVLAHARERADAAAAADSDVDSDVDPDADAGGCGSASACERRMPTKSGLMLGLGERPDEVIDVMRDLREAGCETLTLGQYLRPGPEHLPVAEFVHPQVFAELAREGRGMGFAAVASAPFVRSSYHAREMAEESRGPAPR